MFVTDSYFFDGIKTFRLTIKPSSVLRSFDVVMRDLKKFQSNDMARHFTVGIEHQDSLFVLENSRLYLSFGLAVYYSRRWTVVEE